MKLTENNIVKLYQKIKQQRPIIHCITNAVTVNDCANILLAAGASPTMAHHPLEVEEITAGTQALICNFGAIADYEAMEKAGKVADSLDHAIVIDPVGVSGSSYRREKCQALIEEIPADRLGQPEEVGLLALKLAESPLYLTGQIITMDGGFL